MGNFEIIVNGMGRSQRVTKVCAEADNQVDNTEKFRAGEWLVDVANVLQRPDTSGTNGVFPDMEDVTLHRIWPALTVNGRTDVTSSQRATLIQDIGAMCRTTVFLPSANKNLVGSAAVPEAGGEGLDTNPDTFTGVDFEDAGVVAGDILHLDASGNTYTVASASTTTLTLVEELDGADIAAGLDYWVTGTRDLDYTTIREVAVALYQPADDPAIVVCGLAPNDPDMVVAAADGVTENLLVELGVVVGTATRAPYAISGIGRGNGEQTLEFMIK